MMTVFLKIIMIAAVILIGMGFSSEPEVLEWS